MSTGRFLQPVHHHLEQAGHIQPAGSCSTISSMMRRTAHSQSIAGTSRTHVAVYPVRRHRTTSSIVAWQRLQQPASQAVMWNFVAVAPPFTQRVGDIAFASFVASRLRVCDAVLRMVPGQHTTTANRASCFVAESHVRWRLWSQVLQTCAFPGHAGDG